MITTPAAVGNFAGVNLTRTKSVDDILAHSEEPTEHAAEAAPGQAGPGRLRKRLGPFDLMGFGIGIVIGTGIFTLTGIEAKEHRRAGRGDLLRHRRGGQPARGALLRRAGLRRADRRVSAYTYAYATIGEIVAWIIGWDLILEFALGAAVVARGWSGYLAELFDLPASLFGEDGAGQPRRVGHRAAARRGRRTSASASPPGSRTSWCW